MISKPGVSRSSPVEGVLVWWRIRKALRALQGSSEEKHRAAVETLVASSPRCWHGLRKIAFKEKGVRAVSAAKLLFDLGDAQGLFALLEQYSSPEVRREAEALLDQSLRQIGPQRIEALLTEAVRSLRLADPQTWGLAVAVYAMRVLADFRHVLPQSLLTQCILLAQPQYDSLAECRSVFPFTAFTNHRVARPATHAEEKAPETLLRPSAGAKPPIL